ncbi:MAG: MMPL family transporter [Pirellulales bacterium]|nr:MMPL family transporter [Pirellulales bacterium]
MNFKQLGTFVSRHWVLVLIVWLIIAAGLHVVAPRWDDVTHDGDFAYLPDEMSSVRGERLLEEAFPGNFSKSQVAIVIARSDGELKAADYAIMDRFIKAFPQSDNPEDPIAAVWNYQTPIIGRKLVSPPDENGQAALLVLRLRNEFMAINNMPLMRSILETLAEAKASQDFPPGLKLGVSGSAAIGFDMLASAEQSIKSTEWTTVCLVIVILLLVYRAPGLVLVPLVAIGASVFVATDVVASITHLSTYLDWIDFKIFRTTKIFVIVILFGAGTDYCLFLIARYKEELQDGLAPEQAMAKALGHVGSALAASALTTIFGLGMMVFADFGKFSNSGPAIALCLCVALAACITLAPALLRGLGRTVFWPFATSVSTTVENGSVQSGSVQLLGTSAAPRFGRFWQRLGNAVTTRPGLILVVSLLIMLPITRPVRVLVGNVFAGRSISEGPRLTVPVTYDLMSELRSDCPSVKGARLMWKYFPSDQASPVTVVAFNPEANFDSKAGRRKLALLTKELYDFEYVDSAGNTVTPILSVRSLTEPMGDQPGSRSPLSSEGRLKLTALRNPSIIANFVSQEPPLDGKVTRLELVFCYNPFSQESIRLLTQVEDLLLAKAEDTDSPWYGTDFDMVGTTSGIRDLEAVTGSDRFRIQILVVIAVLAILIILLRRPFICTYLILSVLLGYYVTIGASELFFMWLHGDSFLGLDWKVPIFLFVILIAVGEDYNIYLATRVVEEQQRRGLMTGLRVALICTGGIITSCGVIMAGTFASMATGTLRAMQELGFALSLGVLLDTFVIRTIMVPAFLAILARREEQSVKTDDDRQSEDEAADAEMKQGGQTPGPASNRSEARDRDSVLK